MPPPFTFTAGLGCRPEVANQPPERVAEPPLSALLLAEDPVAPSCAPAVDVEPAGLGELVVSAELRDGDPDGDVLAALD
jgi:hypothetical protein